MRKGEAVPLKKLAGENRVSANCARGIHAQCFNLNCTCGCHGRARLGREPKEKGREESSHV